MNFKLTLEYDGTDFAGWQVQPGCRTVQGVLEEAILKLTGQSVRVHGSGRTDAGVHAYGQVASVKLSTNIPPERLKFALNPLLPADVKILETQEMHDDFHARFSAQGKTYAYCVLLRNNPAPLLRHRAWQVDSRLDLERVRQVLCLIKGTHDFKAFCSAGSSVSSTERTIWEASMRQTGEECVITLHGNGFLYNMVRIIVGTAVSVGLGQLQLEDVSTALISGKRIIKAPTAPAQGLYLVHVDY